MSVLRILAIDQGRGVWGAQRYLLRLAPLMAEGGVQLVFAGPEDHDLHAAWRNEGLESIALPVPVERSVRRGNHLSIGGIAREGRRTPVLARLIADVARDGGFDAIWANSHWGHLDAALASRFSEIPTVLHLHEEVAGAFSASMRAAAVRIAARTVAVSNAVAAGLPRLVQHRIDVIPNGIDVDELRPAEPADALRIERTRASLGIGAADIMVFAATRLDPSKRIEDLFAALAQIDMPNVRLVIAGASSGFPVYENSIRVRAAEPDLRGRVILCGPRADVPDLLRASQVFIHAGLIEGMPLGIVEAQSCGVPTVAYSVAGVPEVIRHNETGLLVRPGDASGLGLRLRRLIEQPDLRRQLGLAARHHAVTNHNILQQVSRNSAVISEMCAGARSKVS